MNHEQFQIISRYHQLVLQAQQEFTQAMQQAHSVLQQFANVAQVGAQVAQGAANMAQGGIFPANQMLQGAGVQPVAGPVIQPQAISMQQAAGLGGLGVPQQVQPQVTADMIMALVQPLADHPQGRPLLQQALQAMGISSLPDTRADQYPELYQRFKQVEVHIASLSQGAGQAGGMVGLV